MESILTSQIGAPQTGRLDRHVRRSYLRIGEDASRHRIAYTLEEALRLASLPGEEEGRIYCFRRVTLSGVPAGAMRRIWVDRVQQTLGALAAQAVHGSSPQAGGADAIYFNNLEEALETLLRNTLRSRSNTLYSPNGVEVTKPEWFSSSLLGVAEGASPSAHIAAIVDRLCPPSIAPGAAAALLFAALGGADPAILLSALPSATIREWVRAMEASKNAAEDARPMELPEQMKITLRRAAAQFGWKDPAVVWLATQAVVCLSPSAWSAGTAVKRARATLRRLEEEQRIAPPEPIPVPRRAATAHALVFDDEQQSGAELSPPSETSAVEPAPQNNEPSQQAETMRSSPHQPIAESFSPDSFSAVQDASVGAAPRKVSFTGEEEEKEEEEAVCIPATPPLLGETTQFAGLYFLLNALSRSGIAAALDACPALAEAGLATHIMKQLATIAGVPESDPILLCLHPLQAEFTLTAEILAELPSLPKAWPDGFTISPSFGLGSGLDSAYFLRVWVLAVRRWCWRNGRLTAREVVGRSGRVWLTRTDLDVTLPLAAADIRIRRIGLDIDPGWLPWLGEFGCVVRFHYQDREAEGHEC